MEPTMEDEEGKLRRMLEEFVEEEMTQKRELELRKKQTELQKDLKKLEEANEAAEFKLRRLQDERIALEFDELIEGGQEEAVRFDVEECEKEVEAIEAEIEELHKGSMKEMKEFIRTRVACNDQQVDSREEDFSSSDSELDFISEETQSFDVNMFVKTLSDYEQQQRNLIEKLQSELSE